MFILTAVSSLYAYLWLLIVLLWISPNVIEPWEAVVTLLYFPALVLTAYATDNGWWMKKWKKSNSVGDENTVPKQDEPVRCTSENSFKLLIRGFPSIM